MLSDTIKSRLPATESEILGGFGNISKDHILFHLRKLEREGKVVRLLTGTWIRRTLPEEKPEKTCRRCKMLFDVDDLINGRCPACLGKDEKGEKPKRYRASRVQGPTYKKTCPSCKTEYLGQNHFKDTKNGRLFSRCNACRGKE